MIEWAAKLDWCNGNIGLGGVSYLVQSQWMVAQMRPPSLKAIIAWEGWSDGTPPPPLRLSPSPQLLRAVYFQQGCVKFQGTKELTYT